VVLITAKINGGRELTGFGKKLVGIRSLIADSRLKGNGLVAGTSIAAAGLFEGAGLLTSFFANSSDVIDVIAPVVSALAFLASYSTIRLSARFAVKKSDAVSSCKIEAGNKLFDELDAVIQNAENKYKETAPKLNKIAFESIDHIDQAIGLATGVVARSCLFPSFSFRESKLADIFLNTGADPLVFKPNIKSRIAVSLGADAPKELIDILQNALKITRLSPEASLKLSIAEKEEKALAAGIKTAEKALSEIDPDDRIEEARKAGQELRKVLGGADELLKIKRDLVGRKEYALDGEDIQKELLAAKAELAKKEEEVAGLDEKLSAAMTDPNPKEEEIAKLKEERAKLEEELPAAKAELKNKETARKIIARQIKLKSALDDKMLLKLKDKMAAVEKAKKNLEAKLKATEEAFKNLETIRQRAERAANVLSNTFPRPS